MPDHFHIVDAALPKYLSFEQLNTQGVEWLRENVDPGWTNFNEADPGVTILNELCYALTELGYCIDFPIEDILTQANQTIDFENQFFRPEEILTSTPITPQDYEKLILDTFREITYVQVQPLFFKDSTEPTGIFQVYWWDSLIPPPSQTRRNDEEQGIHKKLFAFLNQHRNVGELFLPPKKLQSLRIKLTGNIQYEEGVNPETVMAKLKANLQEYSCPSPKRYSYRELIQRGETPNTILNGPRLKRGWIPTAELSRKCDKIQLESVFHVLANTPGVQSFQNIEIVSPKTAQPSQGEPPASNSDFSYLDESKSKSVSVIPVPMDHVATFDLSIAFSVEKGAFLFGKTDKESGFLVEAHQMVSIKHNQDIPFEQALPMPQGVFRNIEEYFSVQCTFPAIYALGDNLLGNSASTFRHAQAKQLKGYLMVFDQILANEFAQLSKVAELFSFRKTPIDRNPPPEPKTSSPYPPILQPCPSTYFFQSLYQVPHVHSLFVGLESYRYNYRTGKTVEEDKANTWKRFRDDPYNPYHYGLSQCIETEDEALDRTNRMLDHLLARHGVSGGFFDKAIFASRSAASPQAAAIPIKRFFLQNYHLLSYSRSKSKNILLSPKKNDLHKKTEPKPPFRLNQSDLNEECTFKIRMNFLFDFQNYFTQLADILRCLAPHAKDLKIAPFKGSQPDHKTVQLLGWSPIRIQVIFKEHKTIHQIWVGEQILLNLDVTQEPAGKATSVSDQKIASDSDYLSQVYNDYADQLSQLGNQYKGFLFLEKVLLLYSYGLSLKESDRLEMLTELSDYQTYLLQAQFLFPDYVPLVQSKQFQESLNQLIEDHWPVHIQLKQYFLPRSTLNQVIPAFETWMHTLSKFQNSQSCANQLIQLLKPIWSSPPPASREDS